MTYATRSLNFHCRKCSSCPTHSLLFELFFQVHVINQFRCHFLSLTLLWKHALLIKIVVQLLQEQYHWKWCTLIFFVSEELIIASITCKNSHLHSVVFNPRHGTQQPWNTPQMFNPQNIYFIAIKVHYSTPFSVIVLLYDLLNCVEDSNKLRDDVMARYLTFAGTASGVDICELKQQTFFIPET